MHSVNVALAKHARAHFARRCILQSGLAIATCEELLESSTCAALRTICYPADVSQRVTPHMRHALAVWLQLTPPVPVFAHRLAMDAAT